MSADVEDTGSVDAERPTATMPRPPAARRRHHEPSEVDGSQPRRARPAEAPPLEAPDDKDSHEHHHLLIEPSEDRWRWRRKIRQNPHKLKVYRVGVALLGLVLVCLGFVSGPLPGPGGIPLVLLGLAVWSSEFEWAHRLMQWLKHELNKLRAWSLRRQVVAWICFAATCGTLAYLYVLVIGVPRWMPARLDLLLQQLPGIS